MGDTDGFDEDVRSPDDADASTGSEHLLELLTDLRRRLEAAGPDDRLRRPDATELILQAQERVATLEQMLAWARSREAELTARTVRGDMRVAHLESALGELNTIAKRASEAAAGRLRAETRAAELQQQLTAARAEAQAMDVEVGRLSARCGDLESDLATLADELASTAVARVRAERLERERDIALERARAESRLALDERLRAAGAEREVEGLRDRLREAEQRSMAAASVTEASNGGWEADVASSVGTLDQPTDNGFDEVMPETDEVEDETVEDDELVGLMPETDVAEDEVAEDVGFVDLMPATDGVEDETAEGDEVVGVMQEPDGTEDETIGEGEFVDLIQEPYVAEGEVVEEDEVVDLTEEPDVAEDDAGDAGDEAIVWGEPAKRGGFVGWLRRGLEDDAPGDDGA